MKYIILEAKFTDLKAKLNSWLFINHKNPYYQKFRKRVHSYLKLCNAFYKGNYTTRFLIRKYFNGVNNTFYSWAEKILLSYNENNFNHLLLNYKKPHKINYHYDIKIRKKICDLYFNYKKNQIGGMYSLYNNLKVGFYKNINKNKVPKNIKTFYRWIKQDERFHEVYLKIKKAKRNHSRYEVSDIGFLQMDAKVLTHKNAPIDQKRMYIYDFIDEKTRIAIGYVYDQLSTEHAIGAVNRAIKDFSDLGINIKRIRTDNGAEFTTPHRVEQRYNMKINKAKAFTNFLKQNKITHELTPVRSPQSNGKIERFHKNYANLFRFYENKKFDKNQLQEIINEWYIFYNFQRIHMSLKQKTPFGALNYFLKDKIVN